MGTSFFSKIFGKRVDLDSIRAEIRRLEDEIAHRFDLKSIQSGEWFLDNLRSFVERYRALDRVRAVELAHPERNEDGLADLLVEDAVRASMISGGLTGAAVSAAELTGLLTWGMSLTVGAIGAFAQMLYLVNLQLALAFDIATLNRITMSIEEPHEMLLVFGSALGFDSLDIHGDGNLTELEMVAKSAGRYHLTQIVAKRIGLEIVKRSATWLALPVVNIGVNAVLSRSFTQKVGKVAKQRFGKLRTMKQRIFEMRSRIGTRQVDILLGVLAYVYSDGVLTFEEQYLLRELARSLQASESWQKICVGEIEFDSARFITRFRDPARSEQRELLLQVFQAVADAKMKPNEAETRFLKKLVGS
jgi:hypothetical protein